MINLIKEKLTNNTIISGWKIQARETESSEMFFVKKQMETTRSKQVKKFIVSVYRDMEDDENNKMRGKASVSIDPFSSEKEIDRKIRQVEKMALRAPAPWYPLTGPDHLTKMESVNNSFEKHDLKSWAFSLAESMFKPDTREDCWISTLEIFLSRKTVSLLNSEGLTLNYSSSDGFIEFVVTSRSSENKEYELYKSIQFSDYEPELFSSIVENQLSMVQARARALPLSQVQVDRLILSGSYVKDFFGYYINMADAETFYQKISQVKAGETFFPPSSEADKISLNGLKRLYNSPNTAPFDADGNVFEYTPVIKEGVLSSYIADRRYAYYLDCPVTGRFSNFSISPGSLTSKEMREGSYLEIVAFSDFQMNTTTGTFGGEIRLAFYCDGEKIIPVTGGAISGSLAEVQKNMQFSKEIIQSENFEGPQSISLKGVAIVAAQ